MPTAIHLAEVDLHDDSSKIDWTDHIDSSNCSCKPIAAELPTVGLLIVHRLSS